jgi:hypothetical protein
MTRDYHPNGKWYKDVLFDTLRLKSHGLGDGSVNLFDNLHFPDGEWKERGVHTNMTCSGMLGTPRAFRIYYWGVSLEQVYDKSDVLTILKNLKLRLIFGGNVTMQESPLSVFSPVLYVTDGLAMHAIDATYKIEAEVNEWNVFNEQVGDCLKRFNLEGIWTHYARGVVSDKGEPLELDSTASFRVEAEMPLVNLKGPAVVKVMLMGMELRWGSPPW